MSASMKKAWAMRDSGNLRPKVGILYEGQSVLDGAPIVVVATTGSANSKTGAMVQTWILRADVSPLEAIASGDDASICGSCIHRGSEGSGRSCYVNVGQAPAAVWKAYRRGSYARLSNADIARLGYGRKVRLGSYGDPAAAPGAIWRVLLTFADGHTGYSHAWRNPVSADLRSIVMASVDSVAELVAARAAGWRTFRVRSADEALEPREFVCPASAESAASTSIQCAQCLACDGADSARKGSPVIIAHGAFAKRFAANRANPMPAWAQKGEL